MDTLTEEQNRIAEETWNIKDFFVGMKYVLYNYQQIPKINTTAISILTTFRFDWIESRCRFVASPIAKEIKLGVKIFFSSINKPVCPQSSIAILVYVIVNITIGPIYVTEKNIHSYLKMFKKNFNLINFDLY